MYFAIVDEVDSILIDEARTPLIISGQGDKSTELYTLADRFARTLKETRVAELNEKEDNDELYKDADYIVDEKAKTATLTPSGVKKAEAYFNIDNLTDADNITIQHHINQAIKAHGVMKRDIDYVVKDGEVIIVDEFTGRLMYGRRYNEGLHQAIEAKEGVTVARESKTLATITFQNLLPPLQEAFRHDRYRHDRGGGVPGDLQAGRGGDPHQPAHDPQGSAATCVYKHGKGQVQGRDRGYHRVPRKGPARAGGHHLH